jgi:hypothetical protein
MGLKKHYSGETFDGFEDDESPKVFQGQVYGGHPDFDTLQDAVDFAESNNYTHLVVPPGNYSSIVTTADSFKVRGLGGGRDVAEIDGGSGPAVKLQGKSSVVSGLNCVSDSSPAIVVTFYQSRVLNCKIYADSSYAIRVENNETLVWGCKFDYQDSVDVGSNANHTLITGNTKLGPVNDPSNNATIGPNS